MQFEPALAPEPTNSCNVERFGISSAVPAGMSRKSSPLKPLLAGLLVALGQLCVAVLLMAPEGPLCYRYAPLIKHDGYWFLNIVDRGYQTIVPPINHKIGRASCRER